MKKAFSVWPDLPGNIELPEHLKVSSTERAKLLKKGGFDFHHFSDCDLDDCSRRMVEVYLKKPTVRKATGISDYIRVVELIRLLEEEKCEEVLYLDYDFHLWSLPSDYGITLESHIQPDENGNPMKLWYRGQNSVYYLSQKHLPILINHREDLKSKIAKFKYKPKYCYPMDHLGEIEEKIGFVPGYRHLGSPSSVGNLWNESVVQMLHLGLFLGDQPDISIEGINLIGSSNTTKGEISQDQLELEKIRETLPEKTGLFTEENVKKLIQGIKLRPNYNSPVKRKQLKDFAL